mgnify:CR=1 FL=1
MLYFVWAFKQNCSLSLLEGYSFFSIFFLQHFKSVITFDLFSIKKSVLLYSQSLNFFKLHIRIRSFRHAARINIPLNDDATRVLWTFRPSTYTIYRWSCKQTKNAWCPLVCTEGKVVSTCWISKTCLIDGDKVINLNVIDFCNATPKTGHNFE